jgi:hypothetical protein
MMQKQNMARMAVMFFLIGIILMAISGCGSGVSQVVGTITGTTTDFCADLREGDSLICWLAKKMGIKPEDVAGPMKIANYTALATGEYDPDQALAFIDKFEQYTKQCQAEDVLASLFFKGLQERAGKMPPALKGAFAMIDFAGVDKALGEYSGVPVLTDNDYNMLLYHLDKQKKICEAFR